MEQMRIGIIVSFNAARFGAAGFQNFSEKVVVR